MPARLALIVFGFILSCLMSFIVSGIATVRNTGLIDGFLTLWIAAWFPSWLIALPVVLVVAPSARRMVDGLIKVDAGKPR